MTYRFIVDTYETERIKVLSVWSMFKDEELPARPHPEDARGWSVHEQMIHQCVSEDFWFKEILGVGVGAPPLPQIETHPSCPPAPVAQSRPIAPSRVGPGEENPHVHRLPTRPAAH